MVIAPLLVTNWNWACTTAGSANSNSSGSHVAQAVLKHPDFVLGHVGLTVELAVFMYFPLRLPILNCRSRASRRAEAVETDGIIHPLGIAEIGGAASERVRAHRSPSVAGRIRAGFHHDGGVRCPEDDEAEPVGLHAKAGAVV